MGGAHPGCPDALSACFLSMQDSACLCWQEQQRAARPVPHPAHAAHPSRYRRRPSRRRRLRACGSPPGTPAGATAARTRRARSATGAACDHRSRTPHVHRPARRPRPTPLTRARCRGLPARRVVGGHAADKVRAVRALPVTDSHPKHDLRGLHRAPKFCLVSAATSARSSSASTEQEGTLQRPCSSGRLSIATRARPAPTGLAP